MPDINKEIQQDVAIIVAAMTNIVSKAVAAKLQGVKVDMLEQHDQVKDVVAKTAEAAPKKVAPKTPKKAAPAKEAKVETPVEEEAPTKKAKVESDEPITEETLRVKLQAIARKFGPAKSYELLGGFNASKVKEVEAKDYAALVEKLDATLNGEETSEEDDF